MRLIFQKSKGDRMRASTIIMRGLAWIIISMLVIPPGIPAQDSGQPEQSDRFREEELVQMLAPLALYPDSLIAQILMASTYPLELVEAERWLRQNNNLEGEALDNALIEKTWDPSVKSLCHFPDVLYAMSDKLDQTRKLGDAFLGQEDEVMATIQALRRKAEEQGNLKTTAEQNIIPEGDFIRIEPADPQVVYVPVYDPVSVYGPWWYPAYPPWYWYYPPGLISAGFITFGLPFFIGISLFSWSWFDWHDHHIYVDYDHVRHFDKHRHGGRDSGKFSWQHDPFHRKGVAYRDRTTSNRFQPLPTGKSRTNPETRGYPSRGLERKAVEPARSTIEPRKGTAVPQTRTAPGRTQGSIESRQGTAVPQVRTAPERSQRSRTQDTPFRGIGDANLERKASQRGSESLRGVGMKPQGGSTGRQNIAPVGGGSRSGGAGGGFRR